MTKTDLQKELLEKVKPGTKPSDIKKGRESINKNTSQNINPKPEEDEGYSSDESYLSEEEETNVPPKPKQSLEKITDQILDEQEKTKKLLAEKDGEIWRLKTSLNSFKNKLKTILGINLMQDLPTDWNKKIVKKSELISTQVELKRTQPETPTIYFCDMCQTTKNSKVDGEVYRIEVSTRPGVTSNVCTTCKPNVIEIREDKNKWFFE